MESADEDEGWANVSREEWLRKLDCADLFESDIHNVVLNYLAVQGFQDAAEAFAAEAQLQPEVPLDSVGRRAAIRQSVLAGDVQGAISILQALDGSILLSFPEVHFRLRQQQLCKIIADGEVERAIEFARQVVLPFVDENPAMLPQLEHAMGLLAFREASNSAFGETVSAVAREELADEVDEAILRFYDVQKEATLENILKHIKHVEAALVEKACTAPRLDFSTASQAGIAFGGD
mmetsp:Transcript_102465/g.235091  ORF Transcript_102465/g.235091 Transcript_102465/m.235091 type:complete len:235 (+) Transcript_102465:1624-2328(+)